MIDERILQELDVIGVVEADVRFSPGTRQGILELVAFYRRLAPLALGELASAAHELRREQAAHLATGKAHAEALNELSLTRIALGSLLNKVNAVTAPWRHQQGVNADEIDALANRQVEVEEFLRRHKLLGGLLVKSDRPDLNSRTPKKEAADEAIAEFRHRPDCLARLRGPCTCAADGDADAD